MSTNPQGTDPQSLVGGLVNACNAHDIEQILSFFKEDAVVTLSPAFSAGTRPYDAGKYTGRGQLHDLLAPYLPGLQLTFSGLQSNGDSLTWNLAGSNAALLHMGLEQLKATCEAQLQADKIAALHIAASTESVATLVKAGNE